MVDIKFIRERLRLKNETVHRKTPIHHRIVGYQEPLPMLREHPHLKRPLWIERIGRDRMWTHGMITTMTLAAALFIGYAYGRLRHDE